jgi:hypothetical protein
MEIIVANIGSIHADIVFNGHPYNALDKHIELL